MPADTVYSRLKGTLRSLSIQGAALLATTTLPTTSAAQGAVFVSDGTSGLIAGRLYYRGPSNATPVEIPGTNMSSYLDPNGLPWMNSPFGDNISAARRDLVSANFVYGLPSQTFARIELWDGSGGAGVFTLNETVVGGTSNAVGIIEVIATPVKIRVIQGAFSSGETITGIGITAAASGATLVITKNAAVNGQVSTSASVALLDAGTLAASNVALESKQFASYAAGHELGAFFTTCVDAAGVSADSNQWTGLFTRGGTNGYAVGYKGTAFGFLWRRGGSEVAFAAQTAWNIDKFNGSGPSGLTMANLGTRINIFGIKTGYLGIYGALLMVMGSDRRLWPAHYATLIDAGTTVAVDDPHFVIRSEITKTAGVTTPRLRTASWNAFAVGPTSADMAPQRIGDYIRAPISLATGAERYLFTIQNKLTFAGVTNNTPIRLTSLSIGTDANVSNGTLIRIRRNTPVTVTTFTDIDALNSCCSVSTAGTAGFTTGDSVYSAQAGFGQGSTEVDLSNENIWIAPGESVTFTAESTSTQIHRVSTRWEESL